ncbi:hypothetical protein QWY93_00220 [Echinicola jeungdonensis]|uniref:Uncharacterized protein n=1 Tax=Echinicola jeungdonensis TaxID=709343 RepID=A0ABV5J2L3_9BACT|nr:hypothetical protein [Echinicola jeungdonensis]MDN3667765.1 hypothetical protein [Echinicola jeungdonensis]
MMYIPVNKPAQALVISKTMAWEKPSSCFSLTEVQGSKEIISGPSYREILQHIRISISVGPNFDFSKQSMMAFLAKSIENSCCPATLRLFIPDNFSNGNLI